LKHTAKSEHGDEMAGLNISFILFVISAILVMSYIIRGEKIINSSKQDENPILAEE
jgi:hypothetical protein